MFLEQEELKSTMYDYQLQEITENDNTIVLMAINSAIEEVKSYLLPNLKKENLDGRPRYDVAQIFNKTGNDRNALLLEMTKNVAVWYLIRLCNVDMIHDNIKDRYDRAITWLKDLKRGDVTLDLPLLADASTTQQQPFRGGSRTKFNHE